MEDIFDCFYPYEVILFFLHTQQILHYFQNIPPLGVKGNYSQETI